MINEDALDALLNYIKVNVAQIVAQGRDGPGSDSQDVPLFMHTYALAQPRNAPVRHVEEGPAFSGVVWLGIDPRCGWT